MTELYVPGWTRQLLGGLTPSVLPKELVEKAKEDHPEAGYIPGLGPAPGPGPDPEPGFEGLLAFNVDEDAISKAFDDATGDPVLDKATWIGHYTWAANKWNEYLYWHPDVVSELQDPSREGPDWSGIIPKTIEFSNEKADSPGAVASCGPRDVYSGNGVKFYPTKLALYVYTKWTTTLSASDWRLVMFHEMGHAVGIGILWGEEAEPSGAVPPVNHLLDGTAYSYLLDAFNKLQEADGRDMDGNEQIPLDEGSDAHWDADSRLVGPYNYGGFPNEIMGPTFEAGDPLVISELSVESPRDFGWQRRTDKDAGSTTTPEIKMVRSRGRGIRRVFKHSIPERISKEHIRGKIDL